MKQFLRWILPFLLACPLLAQTSALSIPGSPINSLGGVPSIGQDQVEAYQAAAQKYFQDKTPFRLGNLDLSPHVAYSWSAETGILAAPGEPTTSTSQSISAGLVLRDGRWTFDYTASASLNSSAALKNSLSQQARLAGSETFGFLAVGFAQGYSTSSAPLISTGEQTPIQSYTTTVSFSSMTGNPQWLNLSLAQSLERSSSSPDISSWSASDSFAIPISEKLNAALSPSAGYTLESPGVDMANWNASARISWTLTKKLTFALQGGWETEEVLTTPRSRTSTLVFSGSSSYAVTDTTGLSLSANRSIEPSPLGGDLSVTTGVSLGASQRILTHFNLSANVSHGDTSYLATSLGLPVVRHDQVNSGSLGLGTSILRHVSLSASYGVTKDLSDAAAFAFLSRSFGFSAGVSY